MTTILAVTLMVFGTQGVRLSAQADAGVSALREDLKARRAKLAEKLGAGSIAILWSAPARVYSRDVDYEYRQDSDLLYLTGVEQPETVLVLVPGSPRRSEVLFISPANPRQEHYVGKYLTSEEARAQTGIETVLLTSEFDAFLSAMFNRRPYGLPVDEARDNLDYDGLFKAFDDGTGRLALRLEATPGMSAPLSDEYAFASRARERLVGARIVNLAPLVHGLRQVKTPVEQRLLAESVDISSEAHIAGMRAARPERFEREVESAIESVYLARGAMAPGYPSIVGSGPNATTLHYSASSRRMNEGDLLLVDAAANYQGQTGDITRTYPVGGRFTPPQREIYELVLAAQDAGMKAARIGAKTVDIERASEAVIKQGLLRLGLITDATGPQFRTWYTHGICHWIGMDVHDVGDYKRPLEAGMAFVIEPGLYVRPEALDQLPDTSENRAFREKVGPSVKKYAGIGVRIEDSFLLTDRELVRLSAKVPRTTQEIDDFMRSRK
ncbi:MAG: aminopeptidase P N-terminal domain-containing protein [Vicinamibacterales bacterium]